MNRSVSVSAASLALLVSASLALTGCGPNIPPFSLTGPTGPTGPTTNPAAAERIYVVQQPNTGNGSILQFAATDTGVVTAQSTITPGTPLAHVATDSVGNIYAFNGNIVEFAASASGNPTPLREINAGTAARICCIDGLAVSPAGAIVIGQDNGEIDEWSATATGNVAPERYILGQSEIGGGLSPVDVANLVAVNSADEIFVGAANAPATPAIVYFNAAASGNIAATGTIGPDGLVLGLALDSESNVYATTETCVINGSNITCTGIISVYAANSTASTAPIRVISGPLTQLASPGGIAVDSVGNLYVISTDFDGSNPKVLTFSNTAAGNVAPTASFSSTAWTNAGFNPSIALY